MDRNEGNRPHRLARGGDRDLEDEVRFHLEERARKLEAAGMTPGDARRAARRAFGDPERILERIRRARGRRLRPSATDALAGSLAELRRAARSLARRPAFAAVVVATLGVGIGAVTAAFEDASWTLTDGEGDAERVQVETVDGPYLELLGAAPIFGRSFTAGDLAPGGRAPVALVGEDLWTRRWGRDPAVLGRAVRLEDRPYTVVGVLPRSFTGATLAAEAWVPLASTLSEVGWNDRGDRWLGSVARLRDGVTLADAQRDLDRVAALLEERHPVANRDRVALVTPAREVYLGSTRTLLLVVLGAAALLLAVAGVNVTNLILVRSWARGGETLMRRALGAGRAALVRPFLAEGLVLSATGTALGLVLGLWVAPVLAAAAPAGLLPPYVEVTPDRTVFVVVAGVMTLLATAAGIVPALASDRRDLAAALRERGETRRAGGRFRLQGALVAGEVALAASDGARGFDVAVISRAMAERHYPGIDPVGRSLWIGRPPNGSQATVVGVADDVRWRDLTTDLVGGPDDPDVYVAWPGLTSSRVELLVRARSEPGVLAEPVRRAVHAVDPDLVPDRVAPLSDALRQQTDAARFGSILLVAFSALAVALAAIGLFGALSFAVGRRTREIAVRLALGAGRENVRRMVVTRGVGFAAAGVVAGAGASALLTRTLESFLFDVRPLDAPTYLAVAGVVVAVSALAAWIPAVRATRVAPAEVLAGE